MGTYALSDIYPGSISDGDLQRFPHWKENYINDEKYKKYKNIDNSVGDFTKTKLTLGGFSSISLNTDKKYIIFSHQIGYQDRHGISSTAQKYNIFDFPEMIQEETKGMRDDVGMCQLTVQNLVALVSSLEEKLEIQEKYYTEFRKDVDILRSEYLNQKDTLNELKDENAFLRKKIQDLEETIDSEVADVRVEMRLQHGEVVDKVRFISGDILDIKQDYNDFMETKFLPFKEEWNKYKEVKSKDSKWRKYFSSL